jgi:hypothetical protein
MDAPQGDRASARLRKVDLLRNIVAWDVGSGTIAAVTQDGEVWTCGFLLGQHGSKYRLVHFAEELYRRSGRKLPGDFYDSHTIPRIVREQPWQLRNED